MIENNLEQIHMDKTELNFMFASPILGKYPGDIYARYLTLVFQVQVIYRKFHICYVLFEMFYFVLKFQPQMLVTYWIFLLSQLRIDLITYV